MGVDHRQRSNFLTLQSLAQVGEVGPHFVARDRRRVVRVQELILGVLIKMTV